MKEKIFRYRIELILSTFVFVSFAYFYNGMHYNQISRYDAIFSFVEPDTPDSMTFQIDHFLNIPKPEDKLKIDFNTVDWSHNKDNNEHYYSNKAPGPIIFAVPLYFIIYHVESSLGIDPQYPDFTVINCYLINLFITILPVAISVAFFYQLLLKRCENDRLWAVLLTLSLYFGTLMFPYSSQFWTRTAAAAFIVIALFFLSKETPKAYVICGLLLGLGVLWDYPVAICVLGIGLLLMWQRKWRPLLQVIIGGGIPFLIYIWYHKVCFGNFLVMSSIYTNPGHFTEGAVHGMFIAGSTAQAIWGISFSPYRGLFWYMPILFPAILGVLCFKRGRIHYLHILALYNIVAFFIMNISFNGWHGGASMGPRYQIPVLPFYFILATLIYPAFSGIVRQKLLWIFCPILFLSISNMLTITLVSPLTKWDEPNPLLKYYKKRWQEPEQIHIYGRNQPLRKIRTNNLYRCFNFGELIGFPKRFSHYPWFVFCLLMGFLMVKSFPEKKEDDDPEISKDTEP